MLKDVGKRWHGELLPEAFIKCQDAIGTFEGFTPTRT